MRPVPSLREWRAERDGRVRLAFEGAVGELSIAQDGCARLRLEAGTALPPDPDAGIGRDPWRPAPLDAAEERDGCVVLTGARGALRVEIEREGLAVRARDGGGAVVAELSEFELPEGEAEGAGLALTARPGERFFGFGEKPGPLDKRGERLRMRNRDPQAEVQRDPLYVSIPFLLAHAPDADGAWSRGLLLDAFAPSRFDVAAGRPDRVGFRSDAGGIDATLLPGPRPADVVARLTGRVGRSPLPPLWALGHHQSRWGYRSEREIRALAREIRRRRIPTDVIHLDIDYMDGYRVFTWHPRRFPDPRDMLAELAERGFRAVAIVDPGVKVDPEYEVFRDGERRDVFCRERDGRLPRLFVWPRRAALPDFNRADVRAWWSARHAPLLEDGVSGIWNDMNEPAGWAGELRLGRVIVPYRRQDLSRVLQSDPADPARRVPHERVRNIYGQQQCRATREALEAARPGRRAFVLTRSGYAGIQRHAAVWTGDNRSSWRHLRESLPMLLNLSLSGVPFCGADIGGFLFSCTPELYARWIQIGALYPFARTHSMWLKRRQEPWSFGRRVEAIARAALELRMRLLPYLYGLFREAERTGAPVWRPLFYEFPGDAEAARVEDEVLVGPSLLAAPVLERGARAREVYLPEGTWIDWHDGARYVGPRRVRVSAPLERLPLFGRGGSLVPAQSRIEHVGQRPEEPCVLHVFPGGDGSAELVEDDGESRDGPCVRTPLRMRDRAGGRLRVELGPREGDLDPGERRVRAVVHACPSPTTVTLDGVRLASGAGVPGYTAADGRVHVRFDDRGASRAFEIEPAP